MKESLAIIGSGIAGLGCAHFLRHDYAITLYEANAYAGGHAHTLSIPTDSGTIPVDSGFMVYNEITYPLLTRLFRELAVDTMPTTMSFSVRHDVHALEYCGSSLNQLFAQRRNLIRPRFWALLGSILRFNRYGLEDLENPRILDMNLDEYARWRKHGEALLEHYLLPMSAAVWSGRPEKMREFPAISLLRFFRNHGFLGVRTHYAWRTVRNGSESYVRRLTSPWQDRLLLNAKVRKVGRSPEGVSIHLADGSIHRHDAVILACQADQALSLLENPSSEEKQILGSFSYQDNAVTVHSWTGVLPRSRRAWASWNYHIPEDSSSSPATHYWMNSLQGIDPAHPVLVTLNGAQLIPERHIIRQLHYRHPQFDRTAIQAQSRLPELNLRRNSRSYFCGSYFGYGFHEDGLRSAYQLSRSILQRDPWDCSRTANHTSGMTMEAPLS